MPSPSERLEILNRLERGELTTEQAARLLSGAQIPEARSPMDILEQLERGDIDPQQAAEFLGAAAPAVEAGEAEAETLRRVEVLQPKVRKPWWALLIAAGSLLAALGAVWMRNDLQDGNLGLAFLCAWAPLLLGVLLIVVGGFSRNSPWASIRVNSKRRSGRAKSILNLDMPVPVSLVSKAVKYTGANISGIELDDVDDLLSALEQARHSGNPIIIKAEGDDSDESVDIEIS